jgi:DNA-directed RNA polymerase subunit K/omega
MYTIQYFQAAIGTYFLRALIILKRARQEDGGQAPPYRSGQARQKVKHGGQAKAHDILRGKNQL